MFTGPERGCSISRHMIATITGGIAHGIRARVRASQRSLIVRLSSNASPSERKNWMIVTENVHTIPMRNESPEQAVVEQPAVVLQPVEVDRDVAPGSASVKPR